MVERQPFSAHLAELRARLLWFLLCLGLGSLIGYFLRDTVLTLLVAPLNQPLFYVSPAGGFDFALKLSLFFGLVVSLPLLVYHILAFVKPILPLTSFRALLVLTLASSCLVGVGLSFAYFVSLPSALFFLNTFSSTQVQALISTDEYFSFVTRYLLGFAFLFQLPLALLVVNSVQRIQFKTLIKAQRWVILGSFILAALLTPTPDMFNQLLMALPLILLYQITVVTLWFVNNKKT